MPRGRYTTAAATQHGRLIGQYDHADKQRPNNPETVRHVRALLRAGPVPNVTDAARLELRDSFQHLSVLAQD